MKLKIKLSLARMQSLLYAYSCVIQDMKPVNVHEELLLEHAAEAFGMLNKLAENEQQQYTIKLTSSQALAFIQLWGVWGLPTGSLQSVVVADVIKAADQLSKSPKIYFAHG